MPKFMAVEASNISIRIVLLIGKLVGVAVGKIVVPVVASVISILVKVIIRIIVVSAEIIVGIDNVSVKVVVFIPVGVIHIFRKIVVIVVPFRIFGRFVSIFTTIIANTFKTLRKFCFGI